MNLYTATFAGNLHEVAGTINRVCPEIVPGIVAMESVGFYTIVVYRATEQPKVLRPKEEVLGG